MFALEHFTRVLKTKPTVTFHQKCLTPITDGPHSLCCYCSQRYKAGYKTAPVCNAAQMYACEACQHVFENIRGLTAHQRTCSGGTWQCRWCTSKESETKGKGPGPDGPSTLCSVCASRYRSGYKQPPKRDAQGNFVCERCQSKFASVRGLGSHVRGCSGGNWRCEWCDTTEVRTRGSTCTDSFRLTGFWHCPHETPCPRKPVDILMIVYVHASLTVNVCCLDGNKCVIPER